MAKDRQKKEAKNAPKKTADEKRAAKREKMKARQEQEGERITTKKGAKMELCQPG